jgi:hypothetical protein
MGLFPFLLFLSINTPTGMNDLLLTLPLSAAVFENNYGEIETMLDFIPGIETLNDTILFRNERALVLKDGIPYPLKEIPRFSIERIEVLRESGESPYGKWPGVINIVTKRNKSGPPRSKIGIRNNAQEVSFELGRTLGGNFDLYLAGDIDKEQRFGANLGYKSRDYEIRAWLSKTPYISINSYNFHLIAGKKTGVLSREFHWSGNPFLLRIDRYSRWGGVVSAKFEPLPLLYILPSFRYDGMGRPKLSIGYIPRFGTIVFLSTTEREINMGLRQYGNSITFYSSHKKNNMEVMIDNKIKEGFWIRGRFDGKKYNIYPGWEREMRKQGVRRGEIRVGMMGNFQERSLRIDLKVVDVKLFVKLGEFMHPLFGASWEFRD